MLMTGWRRYFDPDADATVTDDTSASLDASPDVGAEDLSSGADGAPDSQPDAPSAAQQQQWSLRDYIRQTAGLDLGSKYQSDEDAAKGIANAIGMLGRRSQEAELGRQFAPYQNEFLEFLRAQQERVATPRAAQVQQQPTSWWSPPPADESWSRWFYRDAEGNVQFKEDTPVEVRQAIQKRQEYLANWEQRLHTNPAEALRPAFDQLREEVRQSLLQEISWTQQQQAEHQYSQSFLDNNANWIYQQTSDGRVVVGVDGRPVFTPAGAYFTYQVGELQGLGDQDLVARKAYELTCAWAAGQRQRQQQAAPQTMQAAAPPPGIRQTRKPNSGAVPGQVKLNPGSKGKSIREALLESLRDAPDNAFDPEAA